MVNSQREKKSLGNVGKKRGECGWFAEGIQKKGKEAVGMCFFKIMIGDFASKLCIPPAMAKHIKIYRFANATIKSHTGSPWPVKLYRCNSAVFIGNGWPAFVACHSLQFGDFLMFRYNDYLDFDVKIFDRSGCERAPAYLHKNVRIGKKEHEEHYDPRGDPSNGLRVWRGTQSEIVNHQEVPCHSDKLATMGSYCYASKRQPVIQKERDRALSAAASLKLSRPHFLSKMVRTNVYEIFALS
ncbi:putative B3 domain-containing protein Os03g0621600 [Nymphaea colorata]|nr:putative B3 domain-containing protein Os03g0621600 [Nymphaea colorata]